MVLLKQKKFFIILSFLILISSGGFFIFIWKQFEDRKFDTAKLTFSKPISPTTTLTNVATTTTTPANEINTTTSSTNEITMLSPYNELVSKTVNEQTIKNTQCNFEFKIPISWSVSGILGSSKILSPDDEYKNKEWDKVHQDLAQDTQGDAPPGLDARSLYIDCQYNVGEYLRNFSTTSHYKDFENAQHLSDAFATKAFHTKDSDIALLKTIKLDGRDAYEISWIVKMPDGTVNTTYEIVIEENGKVFDIELWRTEYDSLSDAVKQIIQSISFDK